MMRKWPGLRRVMLRLAIWPMILLATCWPLRAESLAPMLPEPSVSEPMVPLRICEQELTALEAKCVEQVTQLERDFAERLRVAVEGAAADAARPLLARIAGLEAESTEYRKQITNLSRIIGRFPARTLLIGGACALAGGVIGWIFHALIPSGS